MSDFFNPTDEIVTEEMKKVQAADREKIQAEVFEETPADFDTPTKEEPVAVEEESDESEELLVDDPDPAEVPSQPELPPEMQAIVDSLNKLTNSLTGMENRIKQTERRVGGITNEFHAAKEAAANQAKAPTPEEMAEAAKTVEAWEDLKKDFPSWAVAINSKIKTETSKFVSLDAFEDLRSKMSKIPTIDTSQLETRLVGLIHPDWKEITQDPEYASWLNVQSDDVKTKAYKGTTAEEAIDVFNQYKAHKVTLSAPPAEPSEVQKIQEQRQKRLKASTTTSTKHKIPKQKSPEDMTEDEIRASIAKEVFAK